MSTQHPDNAHVPPFASEPILGGEDEVKEAHHVFSALGCEEQMWDHEGKEVDEFVVSKLFTDYGDFFKQKKLGQDVFLTLRVPNPAHQKAEGKVLLEVLESIPRFYDVAQHFYSDGLPPIFEVILPMTTNALELNRIWFYYQQFVSGKSDRNIFPNDILLKDWIGEFKPATIHVIPLIEEKNAMLRADKILEEFLKDKKFSYQRVFLARSDPALTYGTTSAVLLLKIALYRIHQLEKKIGIPIYPIVGVGSIPFRGNFKPTNIENCLRGYPSVQTFTVQSAFKFDYPEETVRQAIQKLNSTKRSEPVTVEEEAQAMRFIEKISSTYARQIESIAPLVNQLAQFVPARRRRKLHVGLFGYARSVGALALPRAITFCASLYSIGLPPELLGLEELSQEEIKEISKLYVDFKEDLIESLRYYDPDCLEILPVKLRDSIQKTLKLLNFSVEPDPEHKKIARFIRFCLKEEEFQNIPELISRAGRLRRFLG